MEAEPKTEAVKKSPGSVKSEPMEGVECNGQNAAEDVEIKEEEQSDSI